MKLHTPEKCRQGALRPSRSTTFELASINRSGNGRTRNSCRSMPTEQAARPSNKAWTTFDRGLAACLPALHNPCLGSRNEGRIVQGLGHFSAKPRSWLRLATRRLNRGPGRVAVVSAAIRCLSQGELPARNAHSCYIRRGTARWQSSQRMAECLREALPLHKRLTR